jgi:nucleoside-diphosphate-sugar epimerase
VRIFIAGATGVIGRRVIPALVKSGHEVTGTTRSPEKMKEIAAMGAQPALCDVYDRGKLIQVVGDSRSDVVIHLLTSLPARFQPRSTTAATDRLRREGTGNLLEAARSGGVGRVIAESIAFQYRPGGRVPKTEEDAPWTDAPGSFADTISAVADLEYQVLNTAGIDGIVLRFGWLYGPGTWYAPEGSIGADVKRRRYPIVGDGQGTWSFIHLDDAAAAVRAALSPDRPGAVYNVVDDEPAAVREWLPAFAAATGAPRPLRVPAWLARILAGPTAVALSTRLVGASNARAKAELEWTPRHPSWRTGFLEPAATIPGPKGD